MISINDFCEKFDACPAGKKWAMSNCKTMQDVWDTAKPDWLIWVATRESVLDDKKLREFSVWCCKQIWHLIKDKRSRKAVCVANRYWRGRASDDELHVVSDVVLAAARYAQMDAASYAAIYAARSAEMDATRTSAIYAASDAAIASAMDSALDSEMDSARDAQAKWLRNNSTPNFNLEEM